MTWKDRLALAAILALASLTLVGALVGLGALFARYFSTPFQP